MPVEFIDNSVKVKAALEDATIAFLHEAAGELTTQTQNNMPPGHWFAQLKSAWKYNVDEAKKEAVIGNPYEASLWTEFGTGEHSISPKGGRKGYWVYVKDSDADPVRNYNYKGGKAYTLDEAKRLVAMMRADGLNAYYTKGQRAHRPFHKAFVANKNAIIRRADKVLKARFKE